MPLVVTNGCFDGLHEGHGVLLRTCQELRGPAPGRFVVLLNSDESVRRLKGRPPRLSQEGRALMLRMGHGWVDDVVIFDTEEELEDLLRRLRPDVLVKGADYSADEVVGRDSAGRVVLVPLVTDPAGRKLSSSDRR